MTWRYQKRYYVILPVRCRITDCITSVRPSVFLSMEAASRSQFESLNL